MKSNLGQAAQRVITNPAATNHESLPASRRSEQVWQMLVQMFGTAFQNQYGDTCAENDMWGRAINSFSDAEVKRGMENLQADNLRFPPTLSQFQDACRRSTGRRVQPEAPQIEDKSRLQSRNRCMQRYHDLYKLKEPNEEQVQEMHALWKRLRS